MWLFTTIGFFSIVQAKDKDDLMVRSRSKEDLLNFLRLIYAPDSASQRVLTTPNNDYPYRAIIDRIFVDQALGILITRSLDYTNFKDRISLTPGQEDKLGAYHGVWEIMNNWGRDKRPVKRQAKIKSTTHPIKPAVLRPKETLAEHMQRRAREFGPCSNCAGTGYIQPLGRAGSFRCTVCHGAGKK